LHQRSPVNFNFKSKFLLPLSRPTHGAETPKASLLSLLIFSINLSPPCSMSCVNHFNSQLSQLIS
jgi:hypothetical protein